MRSSLLFLQKYIISKDDDSNVLDMVNYFETNKNIKNLEDQCHIQCYISLSIWATLFLSGALYQYKCHKLKKKIVGNKNSDSIHGAEYSFSIDSDHQNDKQPVIINHNHYHQLRINDKQSL